MSELKKAKNTELFQDTPETEKKRAPRNRTMTLTAKEKKLYLKECLTFEDNISINQYRNALIHGDLLKSKGNFPNQFVDLLIVDPPYNMNKDFNLNRFKRLSDNDYAEFTEKWLAAILPTLKKTATVYVCCDWQCSPIIFSICKKYLKVRNRITWEREKGRGASANWKNCSEDIWFFTVGNSYTFNADVVRLKRKVIAPYKKNGVPKGWNETEDGNFRLTASSNLWTDISVPFWSMPENTDHPTQKPEKLIAKLILASSNKEDIVFDPFMGSGTTVAVSQKLGRNYCGVEIDEDYCALAKKRLLIAKENNTIQGYKYGVFWERNSLVYQKTEKTNGQKSPFLQNKLL